MAHAGGRSRVQTTLAGEGHPGSSGTFLFGTCHLPNL